MKQRLLVLLSTIVFSASAARAASISEAVPDTAGKGGIYITLGGGMAFYNGNTGFGLNANVLTPIPALGGLYVGADVGSNFFSSSTAVPAGTVTTNTMSVQLTPTAIYRFEIADAASIHPYIGLSLGPNIQRQTVNGSSTTSVLFQGMIRPGIFISLADNIALQTEAKFGWIGGNLIFFPHANVSFSI